MAANYLNCISAVVWVSLRCLFLMVPWVGLLLVSVAFHYHSHWFIIIIIFIIILFSYIPLNVIIIIILFSYIPLNVQRSV